MARSIEQRGHHMTCVLIGTSRKLATYNYTSSPTLWTMLEYELVDANRGIQKVRVEPATRIAVATWKVKRKKERRWRNPTFSVVCFSAPAYSMVCSRVFLWTARQHHSLCMLGLGFAASLAIIRVIHNYGKFKISMPYLNREHYCVLWLFSN